MTVKISFADLTHTGQIVSANTFPLGVAMVAAYAKKKLMGGIDIEIFRYPDDFSKYLENNLPKIACFSMYTWNRALSHEYARRIKTISSETITVFGGANFPLAKDEQDEYLSQHKAIDFFIEGEGEVPFVELFNALKEVDFDHNRFKRERCVTPNIRYLVNGEFISGDMAPYFKDLDSIPSPYENGLSDKFFDDILTPMIETTRGCPYSCTFCHSGPSYYNKVRRFSRNRVRWEINYIAERVKVPEFIITDLNFGMFEEDIETARDVAEVMNKWNWPKFSVIATAKNNKDRIIEISKILKGTLAVGATVQSTDEEVLRKIKRKNLPLKDQLEIANTRLTDKASAMSEVILCLPGDSKRAHFKSVFDMVDVGVTLLRNHQFMLLESSEAATREERVRFQMETRYRVQPRCFGTYTVRGKSFIAFETEEICVANSTMSYHDYLECRDLDLSVEIFINDAIFDDLLQFLTRNKVSRSVFLTEVHERIIDGERKISEIYKEFREKEKKNLWVDKVEMEAFFNKNGAIDCYISGEYGFNELYTYRAIAIFQHIEDIHKIAFGVASNILAQMGSLTDISNKFLIEFHDFSLFCKRDFLNTKTAQGRFHFDFVRLMENSFTLDLNEVFRPEGVEIELYHTDWQKENIEGLIKQYGQSIVGLARFFSRAQISALYRSARYVY